ncbi:MAG: XRE family transcriptional regulator [Fibrobacter sp.]|nr:XRE family transcriptional regulator [Fibrobacter sp.]
MARHKVPTPGQAILDAIVWLKMDQAEFARRLGIGMDVLEALISGMQPITQTLANSLEALTGSPAAYWKMLERKSNPNNNPELV